MQALRNSNLLASRANDRRSLRQRHFEFDWRELLGGFANLVEEREPSRVLVDVIDEVLRGDNSCALRLGRRAVTWEDDQTESEESPRKRRCLTRSAETVEMDPDRAGGFAPDPGGAGGGRAVR